MQLRKILLSIFLCVLALSAHAGNVKVRFLNGIQNEPKNMQESVDALFRSYKLYKTASMPTIPKENFGYYANAGDKFIIGDLIELSIQGTIAGIAQDYATFSNELEIAKAIKAGLQFDDATKKQMYNATYQKILSDMYADYLAFSGTDGSVNIAGVSNTILSQIRKDLLDGSSLLIVSHSQGNYFAEAVNSQLTANEKSKVRFIGVASVAASTPNNRYVTFGKDLAVFGALKVLKEKLAIFAADPLPKNEVGYYTGPEGIASVWDAVSSIFSVSINSCVSRWINCPSAMGHSFTDVYMNSSVVVSENNLNTIVSKIIGYMGESIDELNPPISTIKQFQINAIAFQSQVGNQTQYSTGLVLYMPTSTEYDNATVSGLGTASQPDGIVRLKDNGLLYLQTIVTQYGLTTVGDSVLRLPNTLTPTEIPAGTQYTVKIYKGTTLVTTQTITLAGRVFSPSEMTAGMFSSLAPLTYAQLCPNNVATTAAWYTTPSSIALDPDYTTPKSINATLFCSPTAPYTASARVEFGDNLNRRFMSTNTLVAP